MKNRFYTIYLFLSFCFLYPLIGTAQVGTNHGFSQERLQRIDTVITEYIDSNWIKGAAALIHKDDQEVYYKAFGIDGDNPQTALKKDAIFRIASQTKAITTVAVMMLFEEGKFLLDDPISKYIPAFKNPQVLETFNEKDSTYTTRPANREISIRDLITHTSGIDYAQIGSPQMKAIYEKAGIVAGFSPNKINLGEMIDKLGQLPLVHQPGEKFTYSLGIDVLGRLVEVVSGQNLAQFFKLRIFDPLEMEDSYFELPKEKQSRLVQVYTEDEKTKKLKLWQEDSSPGMTIDYPINGNGLYAGGAGLVSTLKDYCKFLQMILNKGSYKGKQLLARHTVDMMSQNQIGALSLGEDKFGLGFQITTKDGSRKLGVSEGSLAWGGFFGTVYWADPKEQIIGLIFLQQSPLSHGELGDKFKVLVYQALL